MRGSGVFKPGHNLVEVGEGVFGAAPGRVGGHEECRFTVHDIAAHVIEVAEEIFFEVELHNAAQGTADFGTTGQITEPADVGHVLTNKLVHQAAWAELH